MRSKGQPGPPLRFSLFVLPDDDMRRRRKHKARSVEVLRRGLVLEYTASEVVRRTVTRAEKTAWPVIGEIGLWTGLKAGYRRAAKMRAHAYHDEQVRLTHA